MTDLIVTPTEARKNFFNLIKIAESGKRKVVINSKKSSLEFVVKPKKEEKKVTWRDLAGGLSEKNYRSMTRAIELTDKNGETKRKLW